MFRIKLKKNEPFSFFLLRLLNPVVKYIKKNEDKWSTKNRRQMEKN